jgi:hypothetical protein
MTEPHIERASPSRDEAPSPTESLKEEGQNYRLLVVANRLPITIKKQAGVTTRDSRTGRLMNRENMSI